MNTINMRNIGLTEGFIREAQAYEGMTIGRVSSQFKGLYKVITEEGELLAEVSGKFRHKAMILSQYPAVGDFVMLDRAEGSAGNGVIHHVLTRKSIFSRKVAGTSQDAQVVATNIDTVFICMALNSDFNLRRLERYLSIAWDSGAIPVVVLTKADLCQDVKQRLDQVSGVAIGVDVLVTTSLTEDGYLPIKSYISSGRTVAFIGSSGVGKSTLINRLIGEDLLATNDIRDDGRGRHTTTRRELMLVPDGGVVIDTPGMREIGIISADLSKSFADINEIAAECRFDDCTHQNEPGCAVLKAVADGVLTAERLESYRKLAKEARYDGLNSKMIEREKINNMFGGMGAMKNARRYAKEKNKRK
jgi:ribosome biogenesis GTPase